MSKRNTSLLCAVAMVAAAALASAQNADRNTGGPTKNDLQLRLTEPTAGQTITGSSVRVAVAYSTQVFGQGQGTKFGEANYPQPRFDVYLDNKLIETLKGGESNVATINDVAPGPHTIAVVAKNVSNEIIDRKEVKVTNVAGTATTETTTTGSTAGTTGSSSTYSSGSGSSTYSSGSGSSTTSTMNDQSPSRPSEPSTSGTTASTTTDTTNMPRTASRAPLAGVLGLGLMAAGVLMFRKAR